MNIRFGKAMILTMAVCSFCVAPMIRGGDLPLTAVVSSETVTAGDQFSVQVNALNATSNTVAWSFPSQLERKITSAQGTFAGSLELRSSETNVVQIVPGAFASREYVSTVPGQITGQAVMEFPGRQANRVVLDVVAASWSKESPVKNSKTPFNRFVTEVEPEAIGKGSGPGRFFREHISAYEPMYFIALAKSPNAKFQISFAYQLLNHDGPLATRVPLLQGFHLGYTQLSLWDWNSSSGAFYDTSYKPEIFYAWKNILRAQPTNWFELDLQGGLKHESNGKGGLDSRSLNIGYFRPTLTLGRDEGLQLTLQPRVWTYLGDVSENPDIADYRGYADLRAVLGWKRGLQVSALGRMGQEGDHRSVQLDVTYPTMRIFGSFSLYLNVQYYYGYGESLLGYNQKTEQLRVGLALFR